MLFVLLWMITKNVNSSNSSDNVIDDVIREYNEAEVIELNRTHVIEGRKEVVNRKMCLGR
jgi:hypothetical protein